MSKLEIVNVNNKLVSVDLTELTKKENLYFNATEIAKQFGKLPKDYLENKTTQRYINAVQNRYNISSDDLIKTTQGGKHQGTWLHQRLAIDFARWCVPKISFLLDDAVITGDFSKLGDLSEFIEMCAVSEKSVYVVLFADGFIKIGITSDFNRRKKELTNCSGRVIDKFYITEKFESAYSLEQHLLNKYGFYRENGEWLNSGASYDDIVNYVQNLFFSKFCIENNVNPNAELNMLREIHGVENVRDNLCMADIELLNNCQSRNQIMIEDGIDYDTRKEKLTQYVDKQRKNLLDGEF